MIGVKASELNTLSRIVFVSIPSLSFWSIVAMTDFHQPSFGGDMWYLLSCFKQLIREIFHRVLLEMAETAGRLWPIFHSFHCDLESIMEILVMDDQLVLCITWAENA